MERKRTCLVALLLAMLGGGAAWAHSVTYEVQAGPLFSFSVPREWMVRFHDDRVVATPADTSAWFGAWELDDHDQAEVALEDAADYLDAWFQDVKAEPPQKTAINGMAARRVDGTAVYNGNPVRFSAVLFEPKPRAICMALGVWDDDTKARFGPIEATLGSIRPVPGG